jgi:hypothetical protein
VSIKYAFETDTVTPDEVDAAIDDWASLGWDLHRRGRGHWVELVLRYARTPVPCTTTRTRRTVHSR